MKMKPAEFIALCACTMMLTALGIDIMLPAFAALRQHFGLTHASTETAKIISFFFMGQVTQILFGALSDSYGRLFVFRIGFPLYIVAGIVAAFAPNLPIMLAARFVAGMGAAAVLTTTIAGVRDRFAGNEMARIMSLVFTIFLFTPVLAPFLGVAILHVASWQAVFLTPPVFAVIVFVWTLRLGESLPRERRAKLNIALMWRSILTVVTNRVFIRYTIITTMLFTALSSYVASSEHIVGEIYGRPQLFAWVFAGIGFFMSCCTLLNSRLSVRYGARKIIKWLLAMYTITGAFLLLITLAKGDPPPMGVFFIAIALLLGINLAVEPNSSALALELLGDNAGMASSVYGTFFFFAGSLAGAVISHLMVDNVMPIVVSFFVLGLTAFVLVVMDKRSSDSTSGER